MFKMPMEYKEHGTGKQHRILRLLQVTYSWVKPNWPAAP